MRLWLDSEHWADGIIAKQLAKAAFGWVVTARHLFTWPSLIAETEFAAIANCKLFLDQIKYCYGLELGSWKCQWWGDVEAFEGSYDDFRIYNLALSAEEVAQVMNG